MPERLGDLAPVLLVECGPCGRRGSYRVCGLIARFGAACSLDHLRRHLTASCRWQTAPGLREGNQYHAKCQARLVLPEVRPPEVVRAAARPAPRLLMDVAVAQVDEWLPGEEGIAHVIRGPHATAMFEAAARTVPCPYSRRANRRRNGIERLFCRLKNWRRIATRYDRLAANYLASVALVAAVTEWGQ